LRIALRITLPVFVAAQAHASPDLAWHHQWLPDGTLQVQAQNRGTAHIQILKFDVESDDRMAQKLEAGAARYLLPGTTAHWELPGATPPGAHRIVIHGHSDSGDFTVTSDSGSQ
jgi:P pilus assembly chaperone PapD